MKCIEMSSIDRTVVPNQPMQSHPAVWHLQFHCCMGETVSVLVGSFYHLVQLSPVF